MNLFNLFKKVRPRILIRETRKGHVRIDARGLKDPEKMMIILYRLMQYCGSIYRRDAGFIINRLKETHSGYEKQMKKVTKPKKQYPKKKS